MAFKVIGISGSLRQGSYNSALLRAAAELAPAELAVELVSIREIPLYDGDIEAKDGVPRAVDQLKNNLASSDGLLLVTPEYNNSIPGVLKNTIDWLSRPPRDISRVFKDLPVGLMGATPGKGGTRFSQSAWLPVFRTLGMLPWYGKTIYLAGAAEVFDSSGALQDAQVKKLVSEYMAGFREFIERHGSRPHAKSNQA